MLGIKTSIVTLITLILSSTAADAQFSWDAAEGMRPWRTVVDGVMGGKSTARIGLARPGVMTFTGDLSLENNGGFSQIRTPIDEGSFADAEGIVFTVMGDGRTYKFDVRRSDIRVMAGAYQLDFDTTEGEWIDVRLPFDQFELYNFGRLMSQAPTSILRRSTPSASRWPTRNPARSASRSRPSGRTPVRVNRPQPRP